MRELHGHDTSRTARAAFPRGLTQPEGGFRFGSDALLLAAFAATLPGTRAADLGTGCGAAGLGWLLAAPDPAGTVLGLDKDPAMAAAAGQNAAALGLADRFTAGCVDVRAIREADQPGPESCDLILCNPPYRDPASGRRPAGQARDAARFEVDGSLPDFAAAAAYLLVNKGTFACIHLAERLTHVTAALAACRLEIKRILPISPRAGVPARQVLLAASKNGGQGLVLEPPLLLYQGTGRDTRLTGAALAFCPFLACNPAPGEAAK
ncbi:tRNA1(Val) (adenine(37)-N6)-methyltransferase [Desulfovibrio sp. TomC]|uniref:tRNA1(Val) (adenine(37)-N6)-methyltransferase n=1 Tax=Desulfovibrio sp. TomC TaxID=1562888 RepID=UPI000574D26E|nr:methyltransferase [Desulfovibrio sp. TomC]KHK01016.1 tRNA (adenine37-N(6))-methyltransferase TrmN6 [Desulfovibrio sp. TomC]